IGVALVLGFYSGAGATTLSDTALTDTQFSAIAGTRLSSQVSHFSFGLTSGDLYSAAFQGTGSLAGHTIFVYQVKMTAGVSTGTSRPPLRPRWPPPEPCSPGRLRSRQAQPPSPRHSSCSGLGSAVWRPGAGGDARSAGRTDPTDARAPRGAVAFATAPRLCV